MQNGNDSNQYQYSQPTAPQDPTQGYSLKWHKFLIYFGLWAGALGNLYSAWMLCSGSIYGSRNMAATVYAYYGQGLHTVDLLVAAGYVALAIFEIYVRFQLAGFKVGAPGKLRALYIASAVLSVLYPVLAASTTGVSFSQLFDASQAGGLIGSVGAIIIHHIYYSKREALFVN